MRNSKREKGAKAIGRSRNSKDRAREKLASRLQKLTGQRKQILAQVEAFKLPFLERGDKRSEKNYAKALQAREKLAQQLEKVSLEIKAIESGTVELLDQVLADLEQCMRLDTK